MVLSLEEIRAQFPALRRQESGYRVAHFDGPGGTQVPQRVVDRVTEYMLHHNANRHWAYRAQSGQSPARVYTAARKNG